MSGIRNTIRSCTELHLKLGMIVMRKTGPESAE